MVLKMYIKYIKRFLDLILSFLFLPILGILFFFTSIIIFIEDKGPIIYRSTRVGLKGSLFTIYKFRTMKVNAEDIRNQDGSTYTGEIDSRITRVGGFLRKTSIDELPQIINVIIGNMSFVGPRPDLPDALNIYKGIEVKKLDVKPGITGYNQAYFRNSIPQEEKFSNDVYYVKNVNIVFDLKILGQTVKSVIFRKNINNNQKGVKL